MGRSSVAKQLESIFHVNYLELILDLIKKEYSFEEISHYINNKYKIKIKSSTIKIHASKTKLHKTQSLGRKSIQQQLAEQGIIYNDLLESVADKTREEISLLLQKEYNIETKPLTIDGYARKNGIHLKNTKYNKIKSPRAICPMIKDTPLINKLPISKKLFHPTSHSGFLSFDGFNVIIETKGYLEIQSKETAFVGIYLKAYKNFITEETLDVFQQAVPVNLIEEMTEGNYISICKMLCKDYINDIQGMNKTKARAMLVASAKNIKNMKELLKDTSVVVEEAK